MLLQQSVNGLFCVRLRRQCRTEKPDMPLIGSSYPGPWHCNHLSPQALRPSSSLPVIAVVLVGGYRLRQVLQQVRTIRQHPAGQWVPMILCLDTGREEAEHFARLLNISVAVDDKNTYDKGEHNSHNLPSCYFSLSSGAQLHHMTSHGPKPYKSQEPFRA